ncbi:glycosyltransferase family 2 protein [Metabacillus indicus]|uniref:Beta-glycosyltransferase n=1 Tax=Metabacillus indicus TaxID=246786 RepID=A0A084H4H8_METID|nr:glycosyltransferase family A protein [Metabacillus indicus]KEZ50334.1 beta-glycosyltransferase [Metabacillus indicus LMG 22858]KEZ54490.1 beta-glycosyltransferase [Metabacillus indicus]
MTVVLTVFTPAYNRAYTLHKCYESLKRQTCKDFFWMIIDDGSTDGTRDLVNTWMKEDLVSITYHFQKNQGMHGAHNTAYERIETELNVCIDSDDYMSDDAVEKIVSFWKEHGSSRFAGIVGLDAAPSGEIIGTSMPNGLHHSTLTTLYSKYKVKGDKKLVYRTDLIRKTPPYPIFPGEKYCPLSYKYVLIDQMHPLLIMNEVLCHVEYLPDGSSLNMINQYKKNPNGFAFFRKVGMEYSPSLKDRFRESVHYVSSSLMIKNKKFLHDSPRKLTTLAAIPFGIGLFLFLRNTDRRNAVLTNRQN